MTDRRPILERIFLTVSERRLRAGWRLALHSLLFVLLLVVTTTPVTLVLFAVDLVRPELGVFVSPYLLVASTVAAVPAAALATWLARRFLDRRTFRSLGFSPTPRAGLDLAMGFAIAGVQMGAIYAFEAAAGWLHFEGWAWESRPAPGVALGLFGWFILYVGVAFYEELLFRGYYLQNLADGMGLGRALVLSSAVFGLAHLTNPGATWAAAIGILGAGLFLAFGWVRTRQLWLPIGLHLGWNFFEGPVFGFPVSGTSSVRLISQSVSGPVLATGGAFGPEAGLIVLPALLLGVLLIWAVTRGRSIA